jgi:hypothetical protein
MNAKEIEALETLLEYIDLDGWEYKDSEKQIKTLSDYLWVARSTEHKGGEML